VNEAVWERLLLVPLAVMSSAPDAAEVATLNVKLPVLPAEIFSVAGDTETPVGKLGKETATVPVNPFSGLTLMPMVPVLRRGTLTREDEGESEKLGPAVTVFVEAMQLFVSFVSETSFVSSAHASRK